MVGCHGHRCAATSAHGAREACHFAVIQNSGAGTSALRKELIMCLLTGKGVLDADRLTRHVAGQ